MVLSPIPSSGSSLFRSTGASRAHRWAVARFGAPRKSQNNPLSPDAASLDALVGLIDCLGLALGPRRGGAHTHCKKAECIEYTSANSMEHIRISLQDLAT